MPGLICSIQNNMNDDLNKFEKDGGYSQGCKEGYHTFDNGQTELSISGDKTRIVLTCAMCGNKVQKEANLNINDLLQEFSEDKEQNSPDNYNNIKPATSERNDGFNSDDFWNKIRGK